MIDRKQVELALEILKQKRIKTVKEMKKGEFKITENELDKINQLEIQVQKLNEEVIINIINNFEEEKGV